MQIRWSNPTWVRIPPWPLEIDLIKTSQGLCDFKSPRKPVGFEPTSKTAQRFSWGSTPEGRREAQPSASHRAFSFGFGFFSPDPRRWHPFPTTRDGVIPPSRYFASVSPRRDAPSSLGMRSSLAPRMSIKQILDGGLTPGHGAGLWTCLQVRGCVVGPCLLRDATSKPRLAVTRAPNRAPAPRGTVDPGLTASLPDARFGSRSTKNAGRASPLVFGWPASSHLARAKEPPTSNNAYL